MNRLNFLYCFIGTNRTGKSSTARNHALSWREKNDGLIISHDPQNNFMDISDIIITPSDYDWAYKCLERKNSLLILDDFRLINDGNRPVKGLSDLLYFRSKYNIDIIVIVHNPSLLINILAHFITHYFIFMTNAQEGSFKNKIPNYTLCMTASNIVNRHVKEFGRGSYPSFPHIIVDCEAQKMIGVNINKKSINLKK